MVQAITDDPERLPVNEVRRRWWALGVIALAQMLVVIDTTIVTIALPSVQRSIGLSADSRQWVITAYTLAFGGALLLGGRLGDRFGRKRMLFIGVLGFALASAAGGAAVNPAMLIAARALQGCFAAILAPSTLALLTLIFVSGRARGKAFGIYSAALMAGAAVGLILGGLLTQYASWRWCLYVNAPLALIVVIGGTVLPTDSLQPNRPALDIPGAALSCGGMGLLVYGLAESGAEGWSSALVIGSLAGAVALLAVFLMLEAHTRKPLLPPRVLASRRRGGALLAITVNTFAMLGMFLFMTYQLQSVMGYSPVDAGLAFLPYVAAVILTSTQITGRLALRTTSRNLVVVGMAVVACGLLLLSRVTPDSSYAAYILPILVLFGLGVGMVMPTSMSMATRGVGAGDVGVASATANAAQQIGGSLGTTLLNSIAVGAAAGYVATHPHTVRLAAAAATHGDALASLFGAAVLVVGLVVCAVLLNNPRSS
jgi:EmrB/QacA subfamily drug resistance transporter